MIEVVYKEDKKEAVGNEKFFHIPKNIRQIGEVDDNYKIYIEDYAYHYLDRMADEVSGGKIAILLGQTNWSEGNTYVFIKSAFRLEGMEADPNRIPFTEEIWKKAGETMEQYFPKQDVVGWFFTMPERPLEITEAIYRAHLNYFAGNDKVFFMMEPMDKEESFFRYESGKMYQQKGYYLYYERNEAMQEFMIDAGDRKPMESGELINDSAVKNFRTIITQKSKEPKEKKAPYFMYASSAAAIIVALALGTTYMNNYEKLKNTQGTVKELSSLVSRKTVETGEQEASTAAASQAEPREEKDAAEDSGEAVLTDVPEEDAKEDSQEDTQENDQEDTQEDTQEEEGESKMQQDTEAEAMTREDKWADEMEQSPQKQSQTTPAAQDPAESYEDTTTAAGNVSQSGSSYLIQPGDTLTSISRAIYGGTQMVSSICEINGISEAEIIYPGETILLP